MKLCIPSVDDGQLDASVSSHFGRAPNYTLFDTDTGALEVVENEGKHRGGSQSPPALIAETGADVVVCSNLGGKAVDRFDAMDIEVYCGAEGTVRAAIEQFESGDLDAAIPGEEYCGHENGHGHHGHDHHGEGQENGHDHHGHEHPEHDGQE